LQLPHHRPLFLLPPYGAVAIPDCPEHVSKYDIFAPDFTSPFQHQEACIAALRASWLVIDRNWTDPNYLRISYPAIRDAEPPETKKFEMALQRGFEFVARDGPFELRRRVKTVN